MLSGTVHPWARRSGAEKAHGARGWSRAASGAARGRPRALLLALERGVLSSALKSAAHGHDQVHVPCIPLFKQESVGYCLVFTGEGSVLRQRESDFFVCARVCQAILTQRERNSIYYII